MFRENGRFLWGHCLWNGSTGFASADGPDPWDHIGSSTIQCWTPPSVITFEDVENARAVSKLWKREIDSSPEYACLRLAKWDYVSYSGRHWTPKDEYEAYRFNLNWNVFRTSWSLANPINNDRLETTSLGELSCPELDQLRSLLRDNGNRSLDVQPGEKISPRPGIWVSPKNRWDGFRDEKGYWPLEKIIIVLYIFWTYNCYLLQLYVHIIVFGFIAITI